MTGSVKVDWWLHNDVSLSGSLQYEKWVAPILAPSPQTNWTSSVQITFEPHGLSLPFQSGWQWRASVQPDGDASQ